MTEMSKSQPKTLGHDFSGELYAGYLFVHECSGQPPHHKSWLWLVENLKTGKAELWRGCDLNRIVLKNERTQRCKGDGYLYIPSSWYYEDMERARQRLSEIKAAEPPHSCVVVTGTDEEGTVTERCGRTANRRYYGTDADDVRYEMWFCADHVDFMTNVDWHKRTYY
jgi:hypothetical protein